MSLEDTPFVAFSTEEVRRLLGETTMSQSEEKAYVPVHTFHESESAPENFWLVAENNGSQVKINLQKLLDYLDKRGRVDTPVAASPRGRASGSQA